MKSIEYFICIMLFFSTSVLFSQGGSPENDGASSYYLKSFKVLDLRVDRRGYVVYYERGNGKSSRVFIPHSFFKNSPRSAIYMRASSSAGPLMSVFYQDGAVDRILIYLNSGGSLPSLGAPSHEQRYTDEDFQGSEENLSFAF